MDLFNDQQVMNDRVSKQFYDAIQKTWRDGKVFEGKQGFRSVRCVNGVGMNSDGIGTKMVLGMDRGVVDGLGFDLVAMVCDDAIAGGGDPFMMTTTLDFGDRYLLQDNFIDKLSSGLVKATDIAGVSVVGGETAEMNNIKEGAIWNATVVWRICSSGIIDGSKIKDGDTIIAFKEGGCRSNGFTRLRSLLHRAPSLQIQPDTKHSLALQPSTIYTPMIRPLLQIGTPISGMIHVTGGGILGRLKSYLQPSGFGAILYNLYPPGELFQHILDSNLTSRRDAYSTWCMGNGFFLITPDPDAIIAELNLLGYKRDGSLYQVAGKVTKSEKILIELSETMEA